MRGVAWLTVLGAALAAALAVAACEPDYAHTAFLCDRDHGCPSEQTCMMGRCRRGAPTGDGVLCGSNRCALSDQCCLYEPGEPTCIAAGSACPDAAALCDGIEDCQDGDLCCADGNTVACDRTCHTWACLDGDDCPTTEPHCCHEDDRPWGTCSQPPC